MEDDRLVQLALTRGYVTQAQIDRAKAEQKTLADRGVDHGVYFLLQDLGFLTDSDARELRRSVSSSAIRALEVDGFVIQGRLGSGGMGDVFRAVHPDGRLAAVKLLSSKLAKSEEYVRRFLRESRAMQRLSHPYVVGVYGSGESLGTRYILMELVEGPSLKSWLVDKGRLEPGHAAVVLRQMAEALGYAWGHGVLHRDVKPANIILGPPRPGVAEPFCAKLCDFGLARLGPDAGEADLSHGGLTGTGLALGTPHYMSPEQASGEHDIDQRADLYGLGATLYHALLGQTLYSGKSSAVIMYKQVTETVDLQQLRAINVDEPLVSLLGRMLEKRRHARIADWQEIIAAANRLAPAGTSVPTPLAAPVAPASPPVPTPAAGPAVAAAPVAPPPPRRALLRLVLLTALVVALAVAVLVGLLLSRGGAVNVGPGGLPAALARVGTGGVHEIRLQPGRYQGPIRLGAVHRGLRLRAAGPGVVLVAPPGLAALVCEPGLTEAELHGLLIEGRVDTIGGCTLRLLDSQVQGGMDIAGGVVITERTRISGRLQISDRGSLELHASTMDGDISVERGDLRLESSVVRGQVAVRSGGLNARGVRIDAAVAPALLLDRARLEATDLSLTSPGIGFTAQATTIPILAGLTITGAGPSILWTGERQAGWQWERFDLATPPSGLSGPLPGPPGALLPQTLP